MFIALALSITLAVETLVYNFLKPWNLKLFLIVIFINALLNPLMNIVLLQFRNFGSYLQFLFIFEILTSLIEATVLFIFLKKDYLRILRVAFLANLASFLIGDILNHFIINEKGALVGSLIFMVSTSILLVIDIFISRRFDNKDNSDYQSRNHQTEGKNASYHK